MFVYFNIDQVQIQQLRCYLNLKGFWIGFCIAAAILLIMQVTFIVRMDFQQIANIAMGRYKRSLSSISSISQRKLSLEPEMLSTESSSKSSSQQQIIQFSKEAKTIVAQKTLVVFLLLVLFLVLVFCRKLLDVTQPFVAPTLTATSNHTL
jgi:hypothetical protein